MQVRDVGGLFHTQRPFRQLAGIPTFSLFADGRVIAPAPQGEYEPRKALPQVQVGTVTRQTVRRIVVEAQTAGVDGTERDYGTLDFIDDPGRTVFTLRREDGTRVETTVEALNRDTLDAPELTGGPTSRAARRKLQEFKERLGDLNKWLGAGTLSEPRSYAFSGVAIFARPLQDYETRMPESNYVWRGPDPATGTKIPSGGMCMTLSGAALESIRSDLEKSDPSTNWQSATNEWRFELRPLLPHESGCTNFVSADD